MPESAAEASEPRNPSLGGHMPTLDGVRALAVLLVVWHHSLLGARPEHWLDRTAVALAHSSWMGVDLFFVLSGFLITGILVDTRETKVYYRAFYWRRLLRIFPLYYAYLAGIFVLAPLLGRPIYTLSAGETLWFWFYLSNFHLAQGWAVGGRGIGHLWSLAIEEQFYLAWPSLIRWLDARRLFALVIALLIGVPILRWALAVGGTSDQAIYVLTFTRIDSLAAGALVALLARRPGGLVRFRGPARAVFAAGSLTLAARCFAQEGIYFGSFSPFETAWIYSAIAATSASSIALLLTSPARSIASRVFDLRPLRLIGKYSYAIYVLHVGIYAILRNQQIHPWRWVRPGELQIAAWLGFFLLVAGLSIAAAALSWWLFESRLLRLKSRVANPRDEAASPGSVH